MAEQLLKNLKDDSPGVEFLGEQPVSGFIDGLQLASEIGLTAGIAQHSYSPWLHFVLDGKTLYVAKTTYRYKLSWNHINASNAVFGSRIVVINGRTYKIRLLKSVATDDAYTGGGGWDPIQAYGSEWNRLMYSVHSDSHTDVRNPSPVSGEGIRFGTLAQYTDLLVDYRAGNGSYSWCQENHNASTVSRVCRGNNGVSFLSWLTASYASSGIGWRPVLELVE